MTFSMTATARPIFVFDNFTIFVLSLIAAIGIPVILGVYRAARKSGRALGPSVLASFVAFVAVVNLVIIIAGPMSQIIIPSIRSLPTASLEVSFAAVAMVITCVGLLVWLFSRPLPKSPSSEAPTQKPLGIKLFDCSHYRKEHQSILEMDFQLGNPADYRTSITELKGWIVDGKEKLEGELATLWDYRTLVRVRKPYDPERRPPFEEVQLPHAVEAGSTERYVAFFNVGDVVITGEDAKCGLIVKHTHGEEKCDGVSHPSPLQRIAGHLAQEIGQRQPNTVSKVKAPHTDELLILLRKLLTRWQQYMELGDRTSEFAYRENMKSFALGLSDQLLDLDSTNVDSWDFGLRNQVQIVSNELRQFGLAVRESIPELLEEAERHGRKAYEVARALVSFSETQQRS
jgi:hypothetical protein